MCYQGYKMIFVPIVLALNSPKKEKKRKKKGKKKEKKTSLIFLFYYRHEVGNIH